MAQDIEMTLSDASPEAEQIKTTNSASEVTSRHPEIELGDLAFSPGSHSSDGGSDVEDLEEEDYEAARLRRIQENQLLLSSLGIQPGMNAVASSSTLPPPSRSPVSKKRKVRTATYDRSGYIISLPNPGEKHVMACIELPSDRKLRKRIADGDYVDCSHWAEGEGRRWRLGDGKNHYQAGEEVVVGGVGPDFRWRKWLGKDRELRNEMNKRGEMNDADKRGTKATLVADANVSEYSLIPGMSCHQCRRKSEKEKMRCRNTNPECNAWFCISCCKRYSYFEFDPDSRSFICPLCKNICNCSNCIRKRDLAHLLEKDGTGLRVEPLSRKLKREGVKGTVETYLQTVMATAKSAPFERVRLVCQEEDIISPELPPEPIEVVVKPKKVKNKKVRKSLVVGPGSGQKGIKKMAVVKDKNDKKVSKPVIIKFQVPPQITPQRTKEVDSDGDTVCGYSDEDDIPARSGSSSLSSAPSSLSATPPRRLAFPSRPALNPNSITTTSLSQMTTSESGYIRPEMIQSLPSDSPRLVFPSPTNTKDQVIRLNKRKRPPPAASIARAPSYMSNPNNINNNNERPTLTPSNATASSSSSASSSVLSSVGPFQTWQQAQAPALGLYQDIGAKVDIDENIQSSSPDPLILPIPSNTNLNANGIQIEKGVNGHIFLNESQTIDIVDSTDEIRGGSDIPTGHLEGHDRARDRDRDPLFPDTPLWYTYNHNQQP